MLLNFACAYAAAVTLTKDRLASTFAAVTFGGAPFLLVRLGAHLNVLSAWGLPLLLAAIVRYRQRPTMSRAIQAAVVLGGIGYTDYYYFIFGVVMSVLFLALSHWTVALEARAMTPRRARVAAALGVLLVVVIAACALIAVTAGADTSLGPVRVRMTDTFNARVIAGFLVVALTLVWTWPRVSAVRPVSAARPPARLSEPGWALALPVLLLVALLAPLLIAAFNVWRSGDYSSQVYVWRSAPPGIDLASLMLGNQLHPWTGAWTASALQHFGINSVEGAGWLGVLPMALLVVAWRKRRDPDIRAALWIGGIFLVWALGPYLRVFNYNTGLMLPQTLLRYVPIAANARIPGRAFVVVQLMTAILGALALASLRRTSRVSTLFVLLVIAGVLIDYWPAPRHTTTIEVPDVYETLRRLPAGMVLNVPLGIRDGFGARGSPDDRLLLYQTVHEHPQMGGFVARLSTRTAAHYEGDVVLRRILDLSEGREANGAIGACRDSAACSARYLVVDERAASAALQTFVRGVFPAAGLIQRDESLALYSLTP